MKLALFTLIAALSMAAGAQTEASGTPYHTTSATPALVAFEVPGTANRGSEPVEDETADVDLETDTSSDRDVQDILPDSPRRRDMDAEIESTYEDDKVLESDTVEQDQGQLDVNRHSLDDDT